jgi:antitoxin (DNA-binding transcriptional repressor) of toxin-antitoxin stability system
MEPIRVIKASRAVSLRELTRKIAPLVDEVELHGSLFVLSRYGRMVAVLAPIPERTVLEFAGRDWPEPDFEEVTDRVEVREGWAELSAAQRIVLRRAAEGHPSRLRASEVSLPASSLGAAIGRLELVGLLERVVGGWKATVGGLAAARWLDSVEAAPPS